MEPMVTWDVVNVAFRNCLGLVLVKSSKVDLEISTTRLLAMKDFASSLTVFSCEVQQVKVFLGFCGYGGIEFVLLFFLW